MKNSNPYVHGTKISFFSVTQHPCEKKAEFFWVSSRQYFELYDLIEKKSELAPAHLRLLTEKISSLNEDPKSYILNNKIIPSEANKLLNLIQIKIAHRFLQSREGITNGLAEGIVHGISVMLCALFFIVRCSFIGTETSKNSWEGDILYPLITMANIPLLLIFILQTIPPLNITRAYSQINQETKGWLLNHVSKETFDKIKQLKYTGSATLGTTPRDTLFATLKVIIQDDDVDLVSNRSLDYACND